ncbi:pentapeptide repeat-containing protein [Streptomyces sp. DSM 44915]|uniref:Pentapeptide repeat-containing protein n=1 Tax=Streptomyces chisholmiae TaxID=3075540 RepID=A0ABU2JII3_9ACTN|nr:pentapeptide repeat-containing protein [Streptomyces sp. DSM 44915]MDT0264792.1 pentapeptide repeat-containing protein [Streptomyces sp. DSM 44915]
MSGTRGAGGATALRRRWGAAEIAALRADLLAQSRVVRGPHLLTAPWGTTPDGWTDLRGLADPDGLSVRCLTLTRVDLSHASGRLRFHETEVTDGRFTRVVATAGSRLDRRFERCDFRSARLPGTVLGRRFVDCDFSGAKLRKATLGENAVFERCDFTGADLTDATLVGGRFVDCVFADLTLSALSHLHRCAFQGGRPDPGPARLTRCAHDGTPLPDAWAGQPAADQLEAAYLRRYVAAARAGAADTLPLAPESP